MHRRKGLWAALAAAGACLLAAAGLCLLLGRKSASAAYLAAHRQEFDSFVLGSGAAASFEPRALEERLGGRFYNCFHEKTDPRRDVETLTALLEQGPVERVLLVLGPADLFARESGASLPEILPESGVYDRAAQDVESIGSLAAYTAVYGSEFSAGAPPRSWAPCVEAVREMDALCREAGADLTVVLAPLPRCLLAGLEPDGLDGFFRDLAEVTGYWNFALTPLTDDPRYFYDCLHPRTAAVRLLLDRMTGREGLAQNWGAFCQEGESPRAEDLSAFGELPAARIPILLYHHLDAQAEETAAVLHPETFARHMALLKEWGWQTVTFDDLLAFVDRGEPLPEKAVMVTFDDGYLSNYQEGYPVLRELGLQGTIFVIGSSIGHDRYYKETQYELTPHFGVKEIQEMTASGVIQIHSHTYDMHQWGPFEEVSPARSTMLPLPGESDADYARAVEEDTALQARAFADCGLPESQVLAFPAGERTPLTDRVLAACGVRVTLTIEEDRVNWLAPGLPQCLRDLGRLTVAGATTDDDLRHYLERDDP